MLKKCSKKKNTNIMIVGEKIILTHFLLLSGSKTKTAAVIKRRGNAIGNLDSRASLNFSLTESVISFYISYNPCLHFWS